MKFQHLAILGIAATVSVGCTNENITNQTATKTPSTTVTSSSVADSGTFKAGEHPTQGKVRVTTQQGKRYLEFDDNFKTNNGPDLYVILYSTDAPPISGIKEKDYVSVARLQKINGTQRYAIPKNVKLANFKSVAIWCRKFNATFGYASLKS